MHPWVANLLGLALGFTIGGGLIYTVYVRNQPPGATSQAAPKAVKAAPEREPTAPLQATQPVQLPRIAAPLPSRPEPLPNVIYPDAPPEMHKPGSGVAGTGFFIARDGTLVTAAHVVSGCTKTRIASRFVKPMAVDTLAVDKGDDIALLRANVSPPAILPIDRPAAQGGRLFVLGYPANGGPLVPTETWAEIENANMQPAPPALTDPRRMIWAEAPVVAHGFSGGPMVDPRNGAVVGIVRGLVDSTRLHAERPAIPASGMVIGPGSSPLKAVLRQEGADSDAIAVSGDDALDAARHATVHVFCVF